MNATNSKNSRRGELARGAAGEKGMTLQEVDARDLAGIEGGYNYFYIPTVSIFAGLLTSWVTSAYQPIMYL
jgi:hypothetical protein